MRHSKFWLLSSLPCVLAGCSLLGGDQGNSTEDDIAEYEQLRTSLEANRQEILPAQAVDHVSAVGPYVLWLDTYQGWEAVLHIRRYPEGTEITSPVPIGDETTPPFYRASEELAMTALTVGMDSIYSVIDLANGQLLDEVTYAKPQNAAYDAYGVVGNDAYLVVEDEGKMIYSWTAGSGSPAAIGSIDDTGANLGAWIDFTLVEYDGSLKLLALGTYGTYAIELDTMNATQIPLPVTPLEFGITDAGIAVVDGADLWFVSWGDSEARAIHDELKNSSYSLNASFHNAHWVGSGGANIDVSMDGDTIYYRSVAGIHAYNVSSNAIAPILLDDMTYSGSEVFIHYTGINVADNAMIVVGLESTSGSTGADGPIYRVTL
jgi:hypothetical protein